MSAVKLKYTRHYTDRHGKPRAYFRRRGCKEIPLPWPPGSIAYITAYQAALSEISEPTRRDSGEGPSDTLSHVIDKYYKSGKFGQLSRRSVQNKKLLLERLRRQYGHLPVSRLERRHVIQIRDGMAHTPSYANKMVGVLNSLMKFAIDGDLRESNPVHDIESLKPLNPDGHHTWTKEEASQYRAFYDLGSRERLAFELFILTAQRGSDVFDMGFGHLKDGCIHVTQKKTGSEVHIPVHATLNDLLDKLPRNQAEFVVKVDGKKYSRTGFQAWFNESARRAGLLHCTAHGLRKTASVNLADADCTTQEIMAVTGHKTLKEVEKYTRAANKAKLAKSAMSRLRAAELRQSRTVSGQASGSNGTRIG